MITPGALAGRLLVTGLLFGLVLMVEFRGVARHAEREVMALWLLVGGGFALTVVGGVLAA